MKVTKYTIEFTAGELWDFHSMTEYFLIVEAEIKKHDHDGKIIKKVKELQKELDRLL